MKVLLASFSIEPKIGAGAAAAVQALAQGLLAGGHQVVLVSSVAERGLRVSREAGLADYRFRPRNLYWVGEKDRQPTWKKILWQLIDIWNPHSFQVLRRIVEQEQPDLVHVHKLRGLSPAVWSAARAGGVTSIVQTCQDYELMSPEGTLSSRVGRLALARGPLLPYQRLRARLSKVVSGATAPCNYTLDLLVSRGFFAHARRAIVPNPHGLTTAELEQLRGELERSSPEADAALQLLYIGRLETNKGLEWLCRAFVQVAQRYRRLQLHIAGWGSLEPLLRRRYGSHPQITFHGAIFGVQKGELFKRCDVVVVPSIYREIAPLVVSEAYAYGLPVIASAVGGLPELVREDATGWLVQPGSAAALEQIISRLAQEPDLPGRMRPACFEEARRFAVESICSDYFNLYCSLSDNTPSRSVNVEL